MIPTRSLSALALLLTTSLVNAQQPATRMLKWGGATTAVAAPIKGQNVDEPVRIPRAVPPGPVDFEGAHYDAERGDLPFYSERFDLAVGVTGVQATLVDPVYADLGPEEVRASPFLRELPSEPEVRARVAVHRKRPIAFVDVVPFRMDPARGVIQKLISYRIRLVESRDAVSRGGGERDYPANSKLANGEWYRMVVPKDGVYKVTYEQLVSLGVDPNSLGSDRINVYGSHFGLLPFTNQAERPTDLLVNAIEMVDGGDGVFGPGDHFLFYATGPHTWAYQNGRFAHTRHVYSDSSSYFIGVDVEPAVRITPAELSTDPPTTTVTTFQDHQFINRELVNLLKSGRTWLGETFDLTTTYSFNFETPFLVPGAQASLVVDVAARTFGNSNSSSFSVTSSGGLSATLPVQGVPQENTNAVARAARVTYAFDPTGNSVPVTLSFTKFDPVTSVGYLNFLELTSLRELRMTGDQLAFRDTSSVGIGSVAEFVLSQGQNIHRVWEITDPLNVREVALSGEGTERRFRMRTENLRQFIAFRDVNYPTPSFRGRVENQDLHATAIPTDLVIVCPPAFSSQALRLAERRSSEGMSVVMVTPQQIFNEFSSGTRDATAIKRYMRMLYDRAGADPEMMPRHLLLFGDGSYNNLSLASTNQNIIPTYQTAESLDPRKCYVSDDYFGLLDPNEGEAPGDLMDIGVGRLPVHDLQQATEVVNKILNYDRLQLLSSNGGNCTSTGDGGSVDWRTHVLFTSDDQEGDQYEGTVHMSQSDQLARRVESEHPRLNVDKIYLDAYQQVTTPGGERYPQAIQELDDKVQKGALLVNYVGHGGEVGWAHERFLDIGTITSWTNLDRLPLFVTATCEFTRWDDPGRTSAGELVLLNPAGGGIGLMTTSRLAFSQQNFSLASRFYDHIFRETDDLGRVSQLGDVFRETKVSIADSSPNQTNHRNFILIGDPSMRLAMSKGNIMIDQWTDTTGVPVDTLKALATVRVTGHVDDGNGGILTSFNGTVIPTVYDKEVFQSTLANDGQGGAFDFNIRKNVIYRGKASVSNGQFSFTFVVPRDINYQVDSGRISCYAESFTTNASGYTNSILVGGTETDVAEDAQGPEIDLFMNDELFVSGGMTNETPLLFAKLFDENGINTVGSSIGHDLLAVLDENTEQAIVLNDLYEADLDTYKRGAVRYRLSDLSEGSHTLRLKAWDTHNNSTERSIEFVVSPSAELALDRVLNYPNPFTTHTSFFFEHNRPCNTLDVQVQVFTVSGRLIKTIGRQLACEGFRSEPLDWDGRDDVGDRIGRGVYVYRLSVATPDGERAEKFEKLVVLR